MEAAVEVVGNQKQYRVYASKHTNTTAFAIT
ncbi:MAG: hypothetical protein ACI9PZ_001685, partial [Parvicella sp.]